MDPETLWSKTLEALKADMPRASFETWVRDTRAVALEDGVLTVAAHNRYACDWLEERMADWIVRLLSEVSEGAISTVRFAVENETEGEEEGEKEGERAEARQTFTAEAVDTTRYQEEVHPELVVVLPGYALRLLEHGDLTPKQMSLWVGFRQAVYAQRKRGEGVVRNIPHWEVCRFAMMSRASYFRELRGRNDLAGGLVEKVESGSMGDANRYRVHMAPRLTRQDCATLERILTTELSQASTREERIKRATETLNNLAQRNPADYLDAGHERCDSSSWPRNVNEIVRRVIGLDDDLPQALADAAERLTDRILRAFGQVVITHYFLTTVAPALGLSHAQAWAIIILRDRCWFDYETRVQHNFAILPGGLSTLAKWVGTTRRSVELWTKSPAFSLFVQEVSFSDPRQTLLKAGEVFWVRHDEPLEIKGKPGRDLRNFETQERKSETLERNFETQERKSETLESEILRLWERKSETLLKASIKPQLNPNKPQKLPPPAERARNADEPSRVVVFPAPSGEREWVLDRILQNKVVSPKLLRRVRGGRGGALVSWLLYALSPQGAGIMQPWNYALDRLSKDPLHGAGGKYDQLASIPPENLIALARMASKGHLAGDDISFADLWHDVMGFGAGERATTLMRLLLGDEAPVRMERELKTDSWWQGADGNWEHEIEIRSQPI